METVTLHILSATHATAAVGANDLYIAPAEKVPTFAVRLRSIGSRNGIPAQDIDARGDYFRMTVIYAKRIATEVVNLHPCGDRPMCQFVGETVSIDGLPCPISSAPDRELSIGAIQMGHHLPSPKPTGSPIPQRSILVDHRKESVCNGQRAWAFSHKTAPILNDVVKGVYSNV